MMTSSFFTFLGFSYLREGRMRLLRLRLKKYVLLYDDDVMTHSAVASQWHEHYFLRNALRTFSAFTDSLLKDSNVDIDETVWRTAVSTLSLSRLDTSLAKGSL
jgi:hypothetical protein